MKKSLYYITILILLFGFYFSFTNRKVEHSKNIMKMDTYISIKLYSKNKKVDKILNDVESIYNKYDILADAYTKHDNVINVYYLNNILEVGKEVTISDDLTSLIKYGIDVYTKTNGLVNIAMGNVTSVWKKYLNDGKKVPSEKELNNLNININDIVLEGNKFLKKSDVKLDLGSIAKGYVTEEVGNYLESKKIDKYLINAGGNVKVGKSYKDGKYVIGIENPNDTNKMYKKINVENKSVVTSGDYQRYYEVNGIRYNHIINPKTRFPANNVKSVTVICDNSKDADMYSTYLFLLSLEEALNYVNNKDNLEAVFYVNEDNIITSKGFSSYE
ncbi:apbE family lipoprotein [Clostridium sp. CAG:762]|nr:apbE family lipoprotein [Clostridium sp. CAG:762]